MEAQIKEEAQEASLVCLDPAADAKPTSLSLVEKYSRYFQNENSDIDSDCDFFPDEDWAAAELDCSDAVNSFLRSIVNRTMDMDSFKNAVESIDPLPGRALWAGRETHLQSMRANSKSSGNTSIEEIPKSDLGRLDEMIERLAEVRRCEPDGNSIFCTETELEAIQERYGAILDFLNENSSNFDRRASSKDSENEEQVDVGNAAPEEERESMKLLAERIVSVQQARDRFYEIEQQVREQVEQLELVERYKMESVS